MAEELQQLIKEYNKLKEAEAAAYKRMAAGEPELYRRWEAVQRIRMQAQDDIRNGKMPDEAHLTVAMDGPDILRRQFKFNEQEWLHISQNLAELLGHIVSKLEKEDPH